MHADRQLDARHVLSACDAEVHAAVGFALQAARHVKSVHMHASTRVASAAHAPSAAETCGEHLLVMQLSQAAEPDEDVPVAVLPVWHVPVPLLPPLLLPQAKAKLAGTRSTSAILTTVRSMKLPPG